MQKRRIRPMRARYTRMNKNVNLKTPALSPEEAADKYEQEPVDIAVIGAGPAGFSAAINARARGRSVVILSGDYRSSYMYRASEMNNVPGLLGRSGAEILDVYHAHAENLGAVLILGRALLIMPTSLYTEAGEIPGFQIADGNRILSARSVVLATGAATAAPFPGEEEYIGRGVSYCATCDGMLYRQKSVAVIAKTKDAVEEAEHLARIGCEVHLFVSPSDLTRWGIQLPEDTFAEVQNASGFRVEGDGSAVTALAFGDDSIPVSGIFILRASISPSSLLAGLALDGSYIAADKSQATNIPGVYAAGDCTGKPLQVAKALGEGLVAALSADSFITETDKRLSDSGVHA